MFLKAENSENEFNLKARLNVETKQYLRNALHNKTNMLIYLLRLSDMINTVLLLRRVTVSLFKIFFCGLYRALFEFNDPFSDKRNLFLSKLFQFFTKNSRAKLVCIAILFSLDFMLERKGADSRRLREDNSHL